MFSKALLIVLPAAASLAAASPAAESSVSGPTVGEGDATNILDTCLATENINKNMCDPQDYPCLCDSSKNSVMCFNLSPMDERLAHYEGLYKLFCSYASQFPSSLTATATDFALVTNTAVLDLNTTTITTTNTTTTRTPPLATTTDLPVRADTSSTSSSTTRSSTTTKTTDTTSTTTSATGTGVVESGTAVSATAEAVLPFAAALAAMVAGVAMWML